MSDQADMADAQSKAWLEEQLRNRKPEGPAAIGACLYCGEPVTGGKRWCNADCRDEYERITRWASLN